MLTKNEMNDFSERSDLIQPGSNILVVDDEPEMRQLLRELLEEEGYHVEVASHGQEAIDRMDHESFQVVLSDLRMKGLGGLALLDHVIGVHPETNVVMMTAFGTVESAVEAMKQGAFDYLTKPIKADELLVTIQKALKEALLRQEVRQLRRHVTREYSFDQILGKSKSMKEIFDLIRRVADSQTNILITGESGTGKELVAKAIHFNSQRRSGPFVPVNCAAIPEMLLESELFGHVRGAFTDAKSDKRGLFEEAQGGTLFLDEISEMPMMLQAKLLRAVQEREIRRVGATKSLAINVRLIAATNVILAEEVKAKRFREDLYYRLNVIEIRLPPLRDRREDIPLLTHGLIQKSLSAQEKQVEGIAESAMARLMDYAWPGNVRELEQAVRRILLTRHYHGDLAMTVETDDEFLQQFHAGELDARALLAHYCALLYRRSGSYVEVARRTGLDRRTVKKHIQNSENC